MNVVLIGYRGSGKSTVGRLLAGRLMRPFIDLDDRVREAFDGQPIAEIWATHGEPVFRQAEVTACEQVLEQANQVIALGGGTVMQPGALKAITQARQNHQAVTFYLHADADTLAKRIGGDASSQAQRPSLTGQASATQEVQRVLAQREMTYRQAADWVIDVAAQKPEAIVDVMMAQLEEQL